MDKVLSRETKISIVILVFGFLAIGVYWFSGERAGYTLDSERIVLPKDAKEKNESLQEVQEYLEDLKKHKGLLPLENVELDEKAKRVQDFLLKNREFLKDTRNTKGQIEHNDMMSIRPAIVSVLSDRSKSICQKNPCYQAVKYNYVTNTTTRAIVDAEQMQLLELKHFKDMQPDISLRLKKIAQAIALNAPEVKKELGEAPSIKEMSMANVRGSLNNSPCENKEHLCVAPTFSYHDKAEALWAIVDLTDLKLTAAKWAGLGKTATPACISERSLQNREIMENYCQKDTVHEEDGWKLAYRITGSDGLEVVDAIFKGEAVLKSAKIVDWHVAYEGKGSVSEQENVVLAGRQVEFVSEEDKFLFGYNDAMGCPMFSTSVVLPFNAPRVFPLKQEGKKVGFYLLQDYRNPKWPMACNYRYENRFEFYNDGSFRVVGVNIGRGCGEKAIYRPVMRIDMALNNESFYKYSGTWDKWLTEGVDLQSEAKVYAENKYLYKIQGAKQKGYYVEPNRGQFNDGSRGDNARVFVTRFKEDEGDLDLLTLGSCCKLDEDGVERYLETRENIEGQDLVFWYVPKIQNDARAGQEYCWADTVLEDGRLVVKEFPCSVGPKFVPIK
ncbi:MAG: Unknown protein [uncultured Sulfurovum sp.]|uniref:Uncharacterized protein n=1 Tax=uncultured Sulfurovum sp. TaxID=269237 RepID=A0A6S6TF51_9BACT|nr:MAG: Unknown protein [uncultured Sulfurovum sp.]